jgi:chemotaxis signal transduction protein
VTSPFRTTTAFASRRRARPVVERSTFVIATAGDRRVAVPVEYVDRVVRDANATAGLAFGGRTLPVHDLAVAMGASCWQDGASNAGDPSHTDARLLVVHPRAGLENACAVRVNAVHEVFAVESVLVEPATVDRPYAWVHSAVRGVFLRAGVPVWVVDLARILPSS